MSASPPGASYIPLPDQDHDSNNPRVHDPSAILDDNLERIMQPEDEWQHDPVNPRNWSPAKKWRTTTIVTFYTFVISFACSIMARGLPDVAHEFYIMSPNVIKALLYHDSIFYFSFAIGPLFAAPLSEAYGRLQVLHWANLFFVVFNLDYTLLHNRSSPGSFVLRFLAGFVGSIPVTCGGAIVSDLFSERDRASAMAQYFVGHLIGPVVAHVMGSFINKPVVFDVVVGICSIVTPILGILLMRESYAPVIRLRRDKNSLDPERAATMHPAFTMKKWAYLWINLKRPFMIMTRSFICFILSLYMVLIYGIYYLMFTPSFTYRFFNMYHSRVPVSIGIGVGFLSATIFGARICNKTYLHLAAKNRGKGKPEMRVPPVILGSLIISVGLFWYEWSARANMLFMTLVGAAIFGFGMMTAFVAIQLYLVDTFTCAASAIAATSMLRSLLGYAFPFFGKQMFATLGYERGDSLLVGLAIVIGILFPVWIYYAGERMRARSSVTR
ncbi:multidrug resistance protein 4 [Suillus americanus]|nr:multidrug resistance protein 4 [Suillus americanus]